MKAKGSGSFAVVLERYDEDGVRIGDEQAKFISVKSEESFEKLEFPFERSKKTRFLRPQVFCFPADGGHLIMDDFELKYD